MKTLGYLDAVLAAREAAAAGFDEALFRNTRGRVACAGTGNLFALFGANLVTPAGTVAPAPQPGLFWSLAFAVRAATYDRLGGFDETFSGYGAEDTDLAFRAERAGVPILFLGGPRAYHQHHPGYDPPLQHFRDIVANAARFHDRHGIWPMDGWLDGFARLGLIAADRSTGIVVHRDPTPDEMEAARLSDDRPF
ncbi:hypothetical protein MOR12E_06120 [Methylobacterium oryzae]